MRPARRREFRHHGGHDAVHAHMIQSDPSGRFVFSADLALDRILIWKFDAARGTLSPNDPAVGGAAAGRRSAPFRFSP